MRRRLLILFGLAGIFLGAFTALDKYDERACRKSPSERVTIQRSSYDQTYGLCDGFLPW